MLTKRSSSGPIALPAPRLPVTVRPGTSDDLPFIDALQKRHATAVGWMPAEQLRGKVAAGQVLVAEGVSSPLSVVSGGDGTATGGAATLATNDGPLTTDSASDSRIGYVISSDRYFKRDDVGVVYQMNVVLGRQRGLVGATLLKAAFDRAAYGCRLFCCWCAQDLPANRFWEAMGFVPLAFRAGSAGRGRTHIFWQRRVRAGDATTPYWFPSQTTGGSIREDRLVLPIPPGTHWSDAKPVVLPRMIHQRESREVRRAADTRGDRPRAAAPRRSLPAAPVAKGSVAAVTAGGLRFASRPGVPPEPAVPSTKGTTAEKSRRPTAKNDPKLVAAARELRDRWLERVNATPSLPGGKYDVGRGGENGEVARVSAIAAGPALLPSAAA